MYATKTGVEGIICAPKNKSVDVKIIMKTVPNTRPFRRQSPNGGAARSERKEKKLKKKSKRLCNIRNESGWKKDECGTCKKLVFFFFSFRRRLHKILRDLTEQVISRGDKSIESSLNIVHLKLLKRRTIYVV